MVAVGTWALDLTVYSIPQLTVLSNTAVEGDFPPRSVKFAKFEDCCFLLCALGDGYLLVYPMTEVCRQCKTVAHACLHNGPFFMKLCNAYRFLQVAGLNTNPRKLSLGTKPVSLHAFNSNSTEYVFAASDRPSVIYYSNKKLLYSNLNQNEV